MNIKTLIGMSSYFLSTLPNFGIGKKQRGCTLRRASSF